jgi:hypothetical protein
MKNFKREGRLEPKKFGNPCTRMRDQFHPLFVGLNIFTAQHKNNELFKNNIKVRANEFE